MRRVWTALAAVSFVIAGTARAEPITLTVGHSEHRTMFEELARRFSALHPEMRVVLEAASATYQELTQHVLRSALAGEVPDVLFQDFNLVAEIAGRGLSTPLDDLVDAEPDWSARGYTPELMALGTVSRRRPGHDPRSTRGGVRRTRGLEALRRFGEAGMVDMSPNQARQAYTAASLAILATSSSWTATLDDQVGGRFALRAAPFPMTPAVGRLPSGGNAAMILTRDPARRRAAWDLIELATGPSGQRMMVERSGYVPANTPAVTTPELRRFYEENPAHLTAVGMLPHLAPWRAFASESSVKIHDLMEQHLRAVVTLRTTPEEAMAAMAADVRALLPLE